MTDFNVTELRKLAENATPGPWELSEANNYTGVSSSNGRLFVEAYHGFEGEPAGDLEYIAALNPETALVLLDRLERAEAALKGVRALAESVTLSGDRRWGVSAIQMLATLDTGKEQNE